MTSLLGPQDHPVIDFLDKAVRMYAPRNETFNESYKMFYQFDELKEEGAATIATSDVRAVGMMSIHLMSRHRHRDRLPKSIHDEAQQSKRDKAERAVKGWYRQVDFGERGYLRQGRSWHQHELASWLTFTGWAVQYTALLPGPDGEPMPIAHLLDVSSSYPFWDGPFGELSHLPYTYQTTGRRLKALAESGDYTLSEDLPDTGVFTVLDFWEERTNKLDAFQPDVLNSVFYAPSSIGNSPSAYGWTILREEKNFAPGTLDTPIVLNGFKRLPFIVIKPGDIPIAASFQSQLDLIHKITAGGILGPMLKDWKAVNELVSTFRQDIVLALRETSTIVLTSSGGQSNYEASEIGKPKTLDTDETLGHPIARQPMMAPIMVLVEYITAKLEKLTLNSEVFGALTRTLSGVALKSAQEAARAPIEPYKTGMEYLYSETGRQWLNDYERRWEKSSKGKIRVQGRDPRLGFFDEDFDRSDMPDSTFIESTVDLALPEDTMMQANIFRALGGPNAKVSLAQLREHTMQFEDLGLEAERVAAENVEQSDVYINTQVANRLFDLAEEAEQNEEQLKATVLALGAQELMLSLIPQQGQGNAPRPGLGRPEAGGEIPNAGGAEPALSPANRTVEPSEVATPAGPGSVAQARRNAGGR